MSNYNFNMMSWADVQDYEDKLEAEKEAEKLKNRVSPTKSWISVVKVNIEESAEEESAEEKQIELKKETKETKEQKDFIEIKCRDCHEIFRFSNAKKAEFEKKNYVLPKHCFSCKEKRDLVNKRITCRDCFNVFVFTKEQQDDFKQKGFAEPKKCRECKKKNKV
jgi:hypothetical protein